MSVRVRLAAVAAACGLVLAGCGGAAPELVAAPAEGPATSCGEVTLAENPWVGYEANLAVVAYLLKNELKCTVKVEKAAESDSWEQLAAGQVDAILENWSHDDLKKKYIDTQKVAVEGGLTGNKGELGWYVPPWMVEEYPDITDWQKLNSYADLFRTAETGSKGRLLLGDPGFVTNDKDLIRNLGLNYQVEFAGSENALIREFRTAERDREPMIGYFYSPQWFLAEVDLVQVKLPRYTPGCNADPKTIKCGYEPYDLDKILNRDFSVSGSPAAELIRNFQWTDADQNQVARDITVRRLTQDQAAKRWLDGHRTVWRKWLPSSD